MVPLEAAEQHFSLMPDRPAVEEEDDAEVASPLSQLGEVGAPAAKGGYGVFGHHKAGKPGLPHCTAEGMGQVRPSSSLVGGLRPQGRAPGIRMHRARPSATAFMPPTSQGLGDHACMQLVCGAGPQMEPE